MDEVNVEKVVRDYLPNVVHLSLATSRNNKPWVCEVHYAYDDDLNLYFRSLASRRHSQEVADNMNVAGNIVKQHQLDEEVVGVYFEGRCQIVDDRTEQEAAVAYFQDRMGMGPEIVDDAQAEGGHKIYKIAVENWYVFGRFGAERGQKLKLEWGKSE